MPSGRAVWSYFIGRGKVDYTPIPWLRFIRQRLGQRVHFWPFDGWNIPAGRSAIAEVYPSLWNRIFDCEARNPDQHDAYCIAAWLSRSDRNDSLAGYLKPDVAASERAIAQVEGWILGVPGLIRANKGQERDPSEFSLH